MRDKELIDKFFRGEKTNEMHFTINDPVEVISGKHKGLSGSVISISGASPDYRFTIETSSGKDIEVSQSELQLFQKGL